jgi:hypothetical protein
MLLTIALVEGSGSRCDETRDALAEDLAPSLVYGGRLTPAGGVDAAGG